MLQNIIPIPFPSPLRVGIRHSWPWTFSRANYCYICSWIDRTIYLKFKNTGPPVPDRGEGRWWLYSPSYNFPRFSFSCLFQITWNGFFYIGFTTKISLNIGCFDLKLKILFAAQPPDFDPKIERNNFRVYSIQLFYKKKNIQ